MNESESPAQSTASSSKDMESQIPTEPTVLYTFGTLLQRMDDAEGSTLSAPERTLEEVKVELLLIAQRHPEIVRSRILETSSVLSLRMERIRHAN